jgi:hypothetical protein
LFLIEYGDKTCAARVRAAAGEPPAVVDTPSTSRTCFAFRFFFSIFFSSFFPFFFGVGF